MNECIERHAFMLTKVFISCFHIHDLKNTQYNLHVHLVAVDSPERK